MYFYYIILYYINEDYMELMVFDSFVSFDLELLVGCIRDFFSFVFVFISV